MIYEKQPGKGAKWYTEEGIKLYMKGKDLEIRNKGKKLFMRKGFNIKGADGQKTTNVDNIQEAIYEIQK